MPEYPDETALHRLRQEETALGSAETVYLDYAASPPLLTSTIGAFHKAACATLYANPHSRSPASEATTLSIDTVRHQLLIQLLGLDSVQAASEWDVIFTSGATAAAKLLAQHFDWRPRDGAFAYLANATHTSVVGIREAALQHGSSVHPTSLHGLCRFSQPSASAPVLFAYPSQCNATGRCFSLQLCRDIKSANPDENYVLVDAAASLATSSLDLSAIPLEQQPDFVIWSAYKTYGWPTGLGCLFVKRSSGIRVLKRRGYFGGGTMDSMSVYAPFTSRPPSEALLHRTFEDGTLPFLDIVALNSVMQHHTSLFASSLSSDLVGQHARTLTHMAMERMSQIKHGNGQPLCRIYDASFFGEIDSPYITVHGTAVAFTLFDSANQPIGHVELDKLAAVNNIHIRTGGLCNIGAVSRAIGLSDEDLLHHATKLCWDEQEFLDPDSTHRRPTGISRISFGALSTLSDVDRWLTFLEKFFLAPTESTTAETPLQKAVYELQDLSICEYSVATMYARQDLTY